MKEKYVKLETDHGYTCEMWIENGDICRKIFSPLDEDSIYSRRRNRNIDRIRVPYDRTRSKSHYRYNLLMKFYELLRQEKLAVSFYNKLH